ncbi:site-2 protease family protein [Spiroplasma endosymbiont of Labia minor]|uniref:site-2 protease family protein n=1 Tax=Spiroplasma endosymbiont of Labia minor TaxID=3066305 RepID=UPI0030D4416F
MSAGMIVLAFFIGVILLFILITLHELGHFVIAKISKAYVYEFAIGFGPRIITWKGKETWVSIRIFPLGGFCSIASDKVDPPLGREEEDEKIPSERKMDYIARWKKTFFIIGGPLINFFVALFLITTIFSITKHKTDDMSFFGATYGQNQIVYNLIDDTIKNSNPNSTDQINQQYVIWGWEVIQTIYNSQATKDEQQSNANKIDRGGVRQDSEKVLWNNIETNNEDVFALNDNFEMINKISSTKAATYEKTVYNFINNLGFKLEEQDSNIYNTQIRFMIKHINKYDGIVDSEYDYQNKKRDFFITEWSSYYDPNEVQTNYKTEFRENNSVGIAAPTRYFSSSLNAYGYGWKDTFMQSVSILKSFGLVFTGKFNMLAGPVGVASQTAMKIQSAEKFFLYVAEISANLFILNMIFIPPLDGYRFIENIIEMIIRKELPHKVKIVLYSAGAILFALVFIGVTIKDLFL